MAGESKKAVVAAIIGNLAIAVIKFIAGGITGSSAMISEGIHSVVDTGNGGLLFYGLNRGARPADEHHPFGHGMEIYFWSLIVAVSIFGIGGGMSIYEGITHIQHPVELEDPTINYIVLALAMVFESISFSVAWRVFRKSRGSRRTLAAIHHGKDPSLFTVLFEDTAALLGLVVAFFGVLPQPPAERAGARRHRLHRHRLHPRVAALWLAYESRSLLVGEAADPELVADDPPHRPGRPVGDGPRRGADHAPRPGRRAAQHRGQFTPGLTAEAIHEAVHRIEERISGPYPEVNRIFIEVEALSGGGASSAGATSSA